MGDLFLTDFSGGDDAERWRAERKAEQERLYERYLQHLVDAIGIDRALAGRIMEALFLHTSRRHGDECHCSCHPRLSETHDGGFDCSCTWDEQKRTERIAEQRRSWESWWDSPECKAISRQAEQERQEVESWVAGQPGVEAEQTTSMCPEQWEGTVDGHSFYFRERHGTWRIEIDLEPSGHFANRVVEFKEDEVITEPVPIKEGEVIAEGVDGELGKTAVDHIDFIVRKIRDHVWGLTCDHFGSLFFCPKCGQRMPAPQ